MSISTLIIIFGLALSSWLAYKYYRSWKTKQLFNTPLRSEWIEILKNKVGLYSMLPDELRTELHGHIQLFLDEKEFFSQDIPLNDEIKVTIAGNACILLLQGNNRSFDNFTSIIIYPDAYVAHHIKSDGLVEHQESSTRAGESWVRGPIVLSWKDVLQGSIYPRNGHNVVLHEFAHKLDEQNNVMDGLPILNESSDYAQWRDVFTEEYEDLKKRAKNKKNKVLDEYGTISPPEFFAVATESFFEKPKRMRKQLPNLYEQLEKFYSLDPANWER